MMLMLTDIRSRQVSSTHSYGATAVVVVVFIDAIPDNVNKNQQKCHIKRYDTTLTIARQELKNANK